MKLIDLLVKELPKRGGWPECALNATQDKDGQVCFSAGAVPEFGYVAWEGGDWLGNEFYTTRASDYSTAIITREQYESALEASKAVVGHDGWIQWAGGECPVDSDAIVEVKCRWHNQHQYNNDRAGDFYWAHTGSNADIIAYRLQQPGIDTSTNDDRLEQDLNECIGQDVDMPEWNGDGVPPVGIECEVKWLGGEWEKCEVLFVGIEKIVVDVRNREAAMSLCDVKFRPLRTEEEKARESAMGLVIYDLIHEMKLDVNSHRDVGIASNLYRSIEAGNIRGVKLEVK